MSDLLKNEPQCKPSELYKKNMKADSQRASKADWRNKNLKSILQENMDMMKKQIPYINPLHKD